MTSRCIRSTFSNPTLIRFPILMMNKIRMVPMIHGIEICIIFCILVAPSIEAAS